MKPRTVDRNPKRAPSRQHRHDRPARPSGDERSERKQREQTQQTEQTEQTEQRDQGETAFTAILAALVRRVPGARAAVLVDFEGETVDYAGSLEPFDVRVAAAHLRVVLDDAAARPGLRCMRWLVVRAARKSFVAHVLPEGYALVLVLARGAGFAGWERAVAACAHDLRDEAGWNLPRRKAPARPAWLPVEVTCDESLRPTNVLVAGAQRAVEILGAVVPPTHRGRAERGWRVRFDTGAEATLVREAGRSRKGSWYVDEPVAPASPPGATPLASGAREAPAVPAASPRPSRRKSLTRRPR